MRAKVILSTKTRRRGKMSVKASRSLPSAPSPTGLVPSATPASCPREDPEESDQDSYKSFLLPQTVQFGFHDVCSDQIRIVDNGLKAEKKDPSLHYAYGIAYSAQPLRGTSEFEVTMADYGTGWSGTLKLGIARYKTGHSVQSNKIPRYSPEAANYCVWSSDKLHNRLHSNQNGVQEKPYGKMDLDMLRVGDRLGLRLSHDGRLSFFVNGQSQGIAAEKIYKKGHDVYVVVDHYANCKATVITRAVMRINTNLQELCMEQLSKWLSIPSRRSRTNELPLPNRLKTALTDFMDSNF